MLTTVLVALVLLCGHPAEAPAAQRGVLTGAHANKSMLPKSCRACHRGMSMAITGEEQVCLNCHGTAKDRDSMVGRGYLKLRGRVELEDIGAELAKPYGHPVATVEGAHRSYEVLPEEAVDAPRHSECVDCHHPHVVERDRPFRGILGKRVGNFRSFVSEEHELCYKCHSYSANLPASSTDKQAEFRTTNPSYHPVEGEGRSSLVVSLKDPYVARKERPGDVSTITCSDCHGNDDPQGPKGPHGSKYPGMVVRNYEMEDRRPESEFAYALCYECHERSSILGDESFPYHSLHIEGNRAANRPGTSCFTCHDAHGSTVNPYLIRFNEGVVEANADDKLEYEVRGVGTRHGSCLLRCHDVEHGLAEDPKSY